MVLNERTISVFNSKCGENKNSKNLLPKNRATMLIEKLKKKNRHREMKIKLTIKKTKLNKKRKMLEEKLAENNEAMKKIKMKKTDIF